MAVVFYDDTDQVVAISQVTDEIMAQNAALNIFDFDDNENPFLYNDIIINMSDYTVVAGELLDGGSPVVVLGEGDEAYQSYRFRQEYLTAKNFLEGAISDWAGFSDAQKQQWVLDHMDEMMQINLRTIQALKYFYRRV
jgi:hypothetical protein